MYAIPAWGVTLTMGLLVAGLAGVAAMAAARRPGLSAAVLAGTALVVIGVLAMFSVGMFAFILGAALLARAVSRADGERRGAAIGGAALAGAVLPFLLVFALSGPVVECGENSTSGGENIFMSLGSSETVSEGFSSLDRSGGRARGETYEYTYACQGGRLVEFDLRWR